MEHRRTLSVRAKPLRATSGHQCRCGKRTLVSPPEGRLSAAALAPALEPPLPFGTAAYRRLRRRHDHAHLLPAPQVMPAGGLSYRRLRKLRYETSEKTWWSPRLGRSAAPAPPHLEGGSQAPRSAGRALRLLRASERMICIRRTAVHLCCSELPCSRATRSTRALALLPSRGHLEHGVAGYLSSVNACEVLWPYIERRRPK